MGRDEWVLGIDVGTSRSAGAMANGSVTPLEVDGNRWMPSMVLLDTNGNLVVGAAADHQAGVYPERVERTPKRHIGGVAPLLLGGEAVEVRDAIGRLIAVFVKEGRLRRDGHGPAATVLTHPVRWGEDRKSALADCARRVGLDDLILIEEPVAAAAHYVGDQVEVGQCVGVYDLGGGTFDTAILQRTDDGFEVIGAPGGDEFIGGEHFDHLVYEFLGQCLADDDPDLWEQVQYGEDRKWTRAAADLLTQARRAKEAVSSWPSTQALLPLVDRDVVFTRVQLEEMIGDLVDQTVDEMETTIASAGMTHRDLQAIYLVGGSSRIPLVTQRMTERFGDRISTRDEPKSVVSLGAAAVGRAHRERVRSGGGATRSKPAPTTVVADVAGAPRLTEALRVPLSSRVLAVGAGGGMFHVTEEAAAVHQMGADGSWRWSVRLPGAAPGRPIVIGRTVIVACTDGAVIGLDGATGQEQFRAQASGPLYGDPASGPNLVLVADQSGVVNAVARGGRVQWLLPLGGPVQAPITVSGDSVLAVAPGGKVFRSTAGTGVTTFAFPAPAEVTASPAVVGDQAFVACTNGVVYSIDVTTGNPHWGAQLPGPVDGTPLFHTGHLLVADRSGHLTALTLLNGDVAWRMRIGGTSPTGVVDTGRTVGVDTGAGDVLVIDPHQRTVVARAAVPKGSSHPPLVGNGLLVSFAGPQLFGYRLP